MDRNQVEKLLARVSANIFGQCFILEKELGYLKNN